MYITEENIESINCSGEDVNVKMKKGSRSGLALSIFNIANCTIGSGILALPYASQKAGMPISLILITFSCLLSTHTCILLITVAKKTKSRNYVDTIDKSLGPVAKLIVSLCNILFPSFTAITYGIAIVDNFTMVFEHLFPDVLILQNRILVLSLCLVLVIIPLSLPKYLSLLDKASTVSLAFVIFYSFVFICEFPSTYKRVLILPEQWTFKRVQGLPQALAVIFGSFTIHHNIISLYYGLHKNKIERFCVGLFSSMSIALLLYYNCILLGFTTFFGVIRSNLLNNYCVNDSLMFGTRIIFTASIILTYPFQTFAARDTIIAIIQSKNEIKTWKRYVISLILIIVLSIISMLTRSIGAIFEIGYSLSAYPLLMIFPCLAYMKSFHNTFVPRTLHMLVLWVIVIFGIFLMGTGVTMSVLDIFEKKEWDLTRYWCLQYNTSYVSLY